MAFYNKESKLADALMEHPSLIPVINRLGLDIGVGDETIGAVCLKKHIDSVFFISIINTFLDDDYFPSNPKGAFTLQKTIDYLRETAAYYLNVQLPNIDRHFQSLVNRSSCHNNLEMLLRFYREVRSQLEACISYDNDVWFPALLSDDLSKAHPDSISRHTEVEEKLHDLLTFFVVHLTGDYDRNLCMGVVSAIFSLEKDMHQNNRIRNRILLPLISSTSTPPMRP